MGPVELERFWGVGDMGELFGGDVGLAGKENFVGRSGALGFFGLGLDILTKDFFNFYKKIYLNFF